MTVEVWKSVVGLEDYYEVSNLGRVRSFDREYIDRLDRTLRFKGRDLTPLLRNGYLTVGLKQPGEQVVIKYIHRLVAVAFIDNPENKPCVNHIDGVKTKNNINNLEWCTQKENTAHAIKEGLMVFPKGSQKSWAKLSPELIDRAKSLRESGSTYQQIADLIGVSLSVLHRAVNGKTWKHLNEEQ
jgi:hypothetical protein